MAFLKLRYLNQYLKNKQWWESSTWITVNRTSNKPKYWLWGNLYSQMTFVFHCRADSYEVGNVPKRLWITVDFIYLHPQSQNPIYCHPQKTKQFFSAVVNHPTLMFVAECVRCIRFPATFFFYICAFTLNKAISEGTGYSCIVIIAILNACRSESTSPWN